MFRNNQYSKTNKHSLNCVGVSIKKSLMYKLDQYLQPYLVHNLTLSELQKYEVGFLNLLTCWLAKKIR